MNINDFKFTHPKSPGRIAEELIFIKGNPLDPDNEIIKLYNKYIIGYRLLDRRYENIDLIMQEVLKICEKLLENQESLKTNLLIYFPKQKQFIEERCINDMEKVRDRLISNLSKEK
jgi:hypothetical protein